MASLEEQEVTGNLMRMVNDAHYKLSIALFKLHTTVSYFDEVPELCFVDVEEAMKGAEGVLSRVRAVISQMARSVE